jgi:hypothetical protein
MNQFDDHEVYIDALYDSIDASSTLFESHNEHEVEGKLFYDWHKEHSKYKTQNRSFSNAMMLYIISVHLLV